MLLQSSGFSLAMALNVNALLNQILFNYVTCNYSTNVLGKMSEIADIAFDAHWFTFPVDDQKLFPMVIQRTQKQTRLSGYQIITCSRETFLSVCLCVCGFCLKIDKFTQIISHNTSKTLLQLLQSAVSYFIVFRRLS